MEDFKVIVQLKHGKAEEAEKICQDFKKTSESKGEPFDYKIEGNQIIVTNNRDAKQAYRRMGFFERLKEISIYALVKKI